MQYSLSNVSQVLSFFKIKIKKEKNYPYIYIKVLSKFTQKNGKLHLLRWERDRLKRVLCFLGLKADALVSTGLAKLGYIYVNIGMYYVAIDLRRFSFSHKSNFSFSKVGTRNWARTSISDFPRWLLGWNASWCQGLVSLTIFAKLVSLTILVYLNL